MLCALQLVARPSRKLACAQLCKMALCDGFRAPVSYAINRAVMLYYIVTNIRLRSDNYDTLWHVWTDICRLKFLNQARAEQNNKQSDTIIIFVSSESTEGKSLTSSKYSAAINDDDDWGTRVGINLQEGGYIPDLAPVQISPVSRSSFLPSMFREHLKYVKKGH